MQRLAAVPARRQSWQFSHWLAESGWLVPAAALGVALFMMMQGPLQQAITLDSVLLTEESSWSEDDLLGRLLEDAT
jgi:hypothetical protein